MVQYTPLLFCLKSLLGSLWVYLDVDQGVYSVQAALFSPSLNVSLSTLWLFPQVRFFPFQFSSVTQLCLTLCDPINCSLPGFPVYHQLLEIAQTHVHWVGDAIQSSHPLLSPSLPAFSLSIRVFSSESVLTSGGKDWSFNFSISPSNEYSELTVQATLKSHLQHHGSKASIFWCSGFFIVQLSYPYMTTGKTITLTTEPLLAK